MVAVEQRAPRAVAERRACSRGADDVGEEDRRQHAVGLGLLPCAASQTSVRKRRISSLTTVQSRAKGRWPPPGISTSFAPGILWPSTAPPRRHVPSPVPVQHERRHADRREDLPDVDLLVHARRAPPRSRARASGSSSSEAGRRRRSSRPAAPAASDSARGLNICSCRSSSCCTAPRSSPGIVGRPQIGALGTPLAGRAPRPARGRSRRKARSSARPRRRRRSPRVRTRLRPSPPGRRPSASRGLVHAGDRVGHARPALVEEDQPRERRQVEPGSRRTREPPNGARGGNEAGT